MKVLWGLLGLYFLNISVDTADLNPEYIPENLSINDQESIIEIVVEKVLGFEDAIREYDDHDPEDHNQQTGVKIVFLAHNESDTNYPLIIYSTKEHIFPNYNSHLANGFHKLVTPPPKV